MTKLYTESLIEELAGIVTAEVLHNYFEEIETGDSAYFLTTWGEVGYTRHRPDLMSVDEDILLSVSVDSEFWNPFFDDYICLLSDHVSMGGDELSGDMALAELEAYIRDIVTDLIYRLYSNSQESRLKSLANITSAIDKLDLFD